MKAKGTTRKRRVKKSPAQPANPWNGEGEPLGIPSRYASEMPLDRGYDDARGASEAPYATVRGFGL